METLYRVIAASFRIFSLTFIPLYLGIHWVLHYSLSLSLVSSLRATQELARVGTGGSDGTVRCRAASVSYCFTSAGFVVVFIAIIWMYLAVLLLSPAS